MIKMIKGTYGRMVNGVVEAMTPNSAPFSLSEKREAELISAGVAEKVEESSRKDVKTPETNKGTETLSSDVSEKAKKK